MEQFQEDGLLKSMFSSMDLDTLKKQIHSSLDLPREELLKVAVFTAQIRKDYLTRMNGKIDWDHVRDLLADKARGLIPAVKYVRSTDDSLDLIKSKVLVDNFIQRVVEEQNHD